MFLKKLLFFDIQDEFIPLFNPLYSLYDQLISLEIELPVTVRFKVETVENIIELDVSHRDYISATTDGESNVAHIP